MAEEKKQGKLQATLKGEGALVEFSGNLGGYLKVISFAVSSLAEATAEACTEDGDLGSVIGLPDALAGAIADGANAACDRLEESGNELAALFLLAAFKKSAQDAGKGEEEEE